MTWFARLRRINPTSWLVLAIGLPLVVRIARPGELIAFPHLFDHGELVSAAWRLGGSHPPGQPLYSVFAHLFMLLPLGTLSYRAAFFSLVCGGLALLVAAKLCARIAQAFGLCDHIQLSLGCVVALITLSTASFYEQIERPEVYTLALLLALSGLYLLIVAGIEHAFGRAAQGTFVSMLCACVHPVFALTSLTVGMGFFLLSSQHGNIFRNLGRCALAMLIATTGLFPLSFLYLRALAGAPMWGTPTDWNGWLRYVSAQAYHHNLSSDTTWLNNVRSAAGYLFETSYYLPALVFVAYVFLLYRNRKDSSPTRRLSLALFACLLIATMIAGTQPLKISNPDNIAYMSLAFICLVSVALVFSVVVGKRFERALFWCSNIAGVAIWVIVCFYQPLHLRDRVTLESFQGVLVNTPPPRALTLLETDFVAGTWMLAQDTEGARPDVAHFVRGLATSSWQWQRLSKHPALHQGPIARPGPDAQTRYVEGAMFLAWSKVAVLSESRPVAADYPVMQLGPYVLEQSPALSVSHAYPFKRTTPEFDRYFLALHKTHSKRAQEQWDHYLLFNSTRLDNSLEFEVLRDAMIAQAVRVFAQGQSGRAFHMLDLASGHRTRGSAAQCPAGNTVAPWVPSVRDSDAFLATPEDAVRQAAVLCLRLDHLAAAQALLLAQLERGDTFSLLQLGWIKYAAGNDAQALQALQAFTSKHPEASRFGIALSDALHVNTIDNTQKD